MDVRRRLRRALSMVVLLGSTLLLTAPTTAAPRAQPARPLEALFDNRGISDARHPGAADFDGLGRSLPASALAGAGWAPGAELTVVGARLRMPDTRPGRPDNVRADGQRVAVPGRGDALAFLVAATGGAASGRGVVHYAKGPATTFRLSAPDWRTGSPAAKSVTVDHIHTRAGRTAARARLYTVTVPVRRGAEIRSVTLPHDPLGRPALHVFALSVRAGTPGWSGSWSSATAALKKVGPWRDRTLRLVVHSSVGGQRARVRLDNTFADSPLRIGSATLAVREKGAGAKSTPVPLRFGGREGTVLAAGAQVRSDPLDFRVPADTDLLVSLRLPGTVRSLPLRTAAKQTSYVGEDAEDRTGQRGGDGFEGSLDTWPVLTGLDVAGGPGSVVVLGDSTTTGAYTVQGADERWTDVLARRLGEQDEVPHYGVLNQGLTANRLLEDRYPGEGIAQDASGVRVAHRLDRDLFAQTSAHGALLFLGLNDLRWGSSAGEVKAALGQLAEQAHRRGLRVLGATLTPCEGGSRCGARVEAGREQVNAWLRAGGGGFDAVVDFDRAVHDPVRPARLLPAYDSGDGLHPSAKGLARMAATVDLRELRAG